MRDGLLPGGYVNKVIRIGDTVRRPLGERAGFVHELLRHFGRYGWRGAPRFLGVDEQGREVLDYIAGHVAWEAEQPPAVRSPASLVRVAELVREFHDLTAGTALAAGEEVVCHNDLSPGNTVYRDGGSGYRPVAFTDWDIAGPGARLHDVAHMCWQHVGLGPGCPDARAAGRLLRRMCDAYGLEDRGGLVETVLWWQDRCWRGIEAKAAAGDEAMVGLREAGGVGWVRADYVWVAAHRAVPEKALA